MYALPPVSIAMQKRGDTQEMLAMGASNRFRGELALQVAPSHVTDCSVNVPLIPVQNVAAVHESVFGLLASTGAMGVLHPLPSQVETSPKPLSATHDVVDVHSTE